MQSVMYPDCEDAINTLVMACHYDAKNAGWWNTFDGKRVQDNPLAFSNKLCLIHSEISEAMEADRKNLMDDKLPDFDGRTVELADAIVRICDLAGAYNLPLGPALAAKMEYNANRQDHKIDNRKAVNGKKY